MRKAAAGAVDDQRRRLAAARTAVKALLPARTAVKALLPARTAVKALLLAPANGNGLVTKTRDDSAKRCMSTNVFEKCLKTTNNASSG